MGFIVISPPSELVWHTDERKSERVNNDKHTDLAFGEPRRRGENWPEEQEGQSRCDSDQNSTPECSENVGAGGGGGWRSAPPSKRALHMSWAWS